MILGVDHIALSCEDILYAAKILSGNGYSVKFIQQDLPNPPEKKLFMKSYIPFHAVAYCQSKQGISIELTQHSSLTNEGFSPYQVAFISLPMADIKAIEDLPLFWREAWRAALDFEQPTPALWELFKTQLWYDKNLDASRSAAIRGLLLPSVDLAGSESFWIEGLGFRLVNRGSNWTHIALRSPVRTWSLDLILVGSSFQCSLPYIDSPGFPCLALLTNRLTKDKEAALNVGAFEASGEFNLNVGDKLLRITILRGPGNELVELIEIKN